MTLSKAAFRAKIMVKQWVYWLRWETAHAIHPPQDECLWCSVYSDDEHGGADAK